MFDEIYTGKRVSGGKPDGGNLSGAALMKDFIETELKQPVVIVEDQIFDTRQNAQFTLRD